VEKEAAAGKVDALDKTAVKNIELTAAEQPLTATPAVHAENEIATSGGPAAQGQAEQSSKTPPKKTQAESTKEQAAKADFNGHWICTASDDLGPFMQEQGAPWVARVAAKASNYGVGKAQQIIKQNGDEFSVETLGFKNFTQTWTANGPESLTDAATGPQTLLISAIWEDGNKVLSLTMKNTKDGSPIGTIKRYLEGDNCIMMLISPSGNKCKRTFSRKRAMLEGTPA